MKSTNTFNSKSKTQLQIGSEIAHQGLIWRKLSNGTGVWKYDFRINGRRFKGSIGKEQNGITLSAAKTRLSELKAEITLQKQTSNYCDNSVAYKPFNELAEKYIEWAEINLNGVRQLKSKYTTHLKRDFKDMPIHKISTLDVENLKSKLLKQKLSASTIKKVISLLSSIFEYAKKSDPSIQNPTRNITRLKIIEKEIQTLTGSKIQQLLNATDDNTQYQTIIGLAAFAGLRASEILGLEWKNVNLTKREILISQRVVEGEFKEVTKSGKSRIIPVGNKLLNILRSHYKKNKNPTFLISNKDGSHYHHIQKLFSNIKNIAAADFRGGIHILRHSFATNAIEKGVNPPTLQLWMGHSDINTTMRYVHINALHSAEQMKLLN